MGWTFTRGKPIEGLSNLLASQLLVCCCINFVATLALGSRPRQGVAMLRESRGKKPGSQKEGSSGAKAKALEGCGPRGNPGAKAKALEGCEPRGNPGVITYSRESKEVRGSVRE
jgi:hypothetical protein